MQLADFIKIYAEAKAGEIYAPEILAEAEAFANKMASSDPEQTDQWAAIAHWIYAEKIENGK